MPDDELRMVGSIEDGSGRQLTVGVRCGAIILSVPGATLLIASGHRDQFAHLYLEAERQAEAWAAEHGEAS